jgi:hypothetical protein
VTVESSSAEPLSTQLLALSPRARVAFAAVMAERAVAEVAGCVGFTDAHFQRLVYAVALAWECVEGRAAKEDIDTQLALVVEAVTELAGEPTAKAERCAAEAVACALRCTFERPKRAEHAAAAALARGEALSLLYVDATLVRSGESRWWSEALLLLKKLGNDADLRQALQGIPEFERGAERA